MPKKCIKGTRLAQSIEQETLYLGAVSSSPTTAVELTLSGGKVSFFSNSQKVTITQVFLSIPVKIPCQEKMTQSTLKAGRILLQKRHRSGRPGGERL